MLTFTKIDQTTRATRTYGIDEALQIVGRHKLDGRDYVYLDVRSPTSASWVFWYRFAGTKPELGLGSAFVDGRPVLPAKADRQAAIYRGELAAGRNPKNRKRSRRTFGELLQEEIDTRLKAEPTWSQATAYQSWAANYFPGLLKLQPAQIDRALVVNQLRDGWLTNNNTARRALYVIGLVFTRAIAADLFPAHLSNPADEALCEVLLGKIKVEVKEHAAYPHADVPALMARILSPKTSNWRKMGNRRKALAVAVTIPHRAAEIFRMKWADLKETEEGLLWTPAATDNKQGRAQVNIVPWQVEQIVRSVPVVEGNPFVFTGSKEGTHIAPGAMLEVMRDELNVKPEQGNVHGFRSTIATWLQDVGGASDETIANMISHGQITGKHFSRYARGIRLKQRASEAQKWADYVYPVDFANEGNVTPLAA